VWEWGKSGFRQNDWSYNLALRETQRPRKTFFAQWVQNQLNTWISGLNNLR